MLLWWVHPVYQSMIATAGGILAVGGLGTAFLIWIRGGGRGWHRYPRLLVPSLIVSLIGFAILSLVMPVPDILTFIRGGVPANGRVGH